MTARPRTGPTRSPLRRLLRGLALATLALPWAGALEAAGDVQVESHLEPPVVRPDGTVRFTLRVEGEGIRQPRLRPRFDLENLEIAGVPDHQQGLHMGSGGGRWRYSWTWYLRPRSLGEARVTSIRLLVGEREIELPTRTIRVAPDGSAGRPPPPRDGRAGERRDPDREGRPTPDDQAREAPVLFLRAEVDPETPYVGQRTVYTAYLYTRVPVRRIEPAGLPTFDGCWARPVDLSSRERDRVEIDGVRFDRIPLFRRELYPLRADVLDLGTTSAHFVVDRIRREPVLGGRIRLPQHLRRESNRIALFVRPLPAPEGPLADRFGGAVGAVELDARLSRNRVAVGHGSTLTVSVRGESHLEALRAPSIRAPEGIEVIGPQKETVSGTVSESPPPGATGDGDGAHGGPERTWTYLLLPHRIGSWRLPPVEVTYFDPASSRYRTAVAAPGELTVTPREPSRPGPETEALHPIRSAALPRPAPGRWQNLIPWAFGIPWLLALVLLVARRSGRWSPGALLGAGLGSGLGGSAPARPALRRFREDLGRALVEDRPRRAAAALERAWRHLLVDRLGLPASAPVSSWPDELRCSGVDDRTAERLAELLEDFHFLRYAPELSDVESLAGELVDRSDRLGRELFG